MAVTSPRGRSFVRFVADHNPFYLLSAALMLLACLLLGNTMTWRPIGVDRILVLIAVLNAYELLLVALGLYLVVRRKLVRDGVMLLIIEAFFIVDVGFLNSEVYQQNQALGEVTNAALAAIILAKLWVIFRALKLPIFSGRFCVTVTEVAALLFLPGILKRLSLDHGGILHDGQMFASWWLVGGLIAAVAVVTRFNRLPSDRATAPSRIADRLANVFLVLPLISLVAHLGTTHWVFQVPFRAFDLSPMLLGAAMLMVSIPATYIAGRRELIALCLIFIVAGTACAVNPDSRMQIFVGTYSLSSAAISLAAAYLVVIYCFALGYAVYALALGAAAVAIYVFGPSRAAVAEGLTGAIYWAADRVQRLIPQSQREWGVSSAVAAFLMLIVGAWLSLFRSSPPNDSVGSASIDRPSDLTPSNGDGGLVA